METIPQDRNRYVSPTAPAGMGMLIAGGGTGGHLFPGIAIAEEFRRRSPDHRVLFVGTQRGIEARLLPALGYPLRTLNLEGVKGRGLRNTLAAIQKIPGSLRDSFRILKEFQPAIVVGVGGYASGPAVLAARILSIPTAIAEQNAYPGLTNRILGRFADRIFLAFAASQPWFSPTRSQVTGNPTRAAFGEDSEKGRTDPRPRFTLLIFGGSQGAHALNRIVCEALPELAPLKDRLRFIHQTGEKDLGFVTEAYGQGGFTAEVSAFIMDMASAYGEADLLICRAGATSLAEITAAGKASLLVPFPFAVSDHQTKNAEVLSRAGAAEVYEEKELHGLRLATAITRLALDPQAVRKMETAAAALGNRRAAVVIVDACLTLADKH
ncbi:MAG: undecaprenyldiphospho-muramoylpentapeptide beta-N-acetylglucosaminyltransferase [Syntrophaceae bacterium]|nr:undecaprenyldiphospho-muramoylpentapeptide beta-N-acetylglucosaminyltransferase [Syntrophaceae bacterium]